jgi:hypothetical protein
MGQQAIVNQAAFDIGQMADRLALRLLYAPGGNSGSKGPARGSPQPQRGAWLNRSGRVRRRERNGNLNIRNGRSWMRKKLKAEPEPFWISEKETAVLAN